MELAYERRGSGEPLVLVHGIGHHWRAWEPVLDALAEHYDVIAVDLPGFGRSPVPDAGTETGMSAAIERVAAFFAASGLDRPHVAGNSLGGAIALELAAAGLVASATALAPAGFASRAQLRWALTVLRGHRLGAFTPTPVLRAFFQLELGRALAFGTLMAQPRRITAERALADTLAFRRAKAFRSVAKAGRRYTFEARSMTVPVTVAWGTGDRILRYSQAERARHLLPDARHVTLDGCGHIPMSDAPDAVVEVIRETTKAASS
jgi:pimeloyl-ACP methyl ester carboxylesterase